MNEKLYMVFDVESVGLHGEGFAVGFVVIDTVQGEIANGLYFCPQNHATGTPESRKWVEENIPRLTSGVKFSHPKQIRDIFWNQWLTWKEKGALLVADCAWPVEARFLNQCVDDSPKEREWQGAYPLIDLSSILLANGKDPIMKFPRKENETPEHNPLCDARQSARILIKFLHSK